MISLSIVALYVMGAVFGFRRARDMTLLDPEGLMSGNHVSSMERAVCLVGWLAGALFWPVYLTLSMVIHSGLMRTVAEREAELKQREREASYKMVQAQRILDQWDRDHKEESQ